MLNRRQALGFLLTLTGSVTACRSLQAEASFRTPNELTATAEAKDLHLTPTPPAPASAAPTAALTPRPTLASAPSPPIPAVPPAVTPQATPIATLGKLAYVQESDIWVKDLPDGAPRRLTKHGTNDTPRWSPSGTWLAFLKRANASDLQQLWVIRTDGTDAHTVDDIQPKPGLQFDWSPLADRLAHISPSGLFAENADGSARQQLVPQPAVGPGHGGINALAWAPDGAWLAFERLDWGTTPTSNTAAPTSASQGVWRVRADGSEIHGVFLNSNPGQAQSFLVGWSPNGQQLLFWSGIGSASLLMDGAALIAVPVAGGTPTAITSRMLLHRDFLSWSPDGQQLCLVDGGDRSTWYNKSLAVTRLGGAKRSLSDSERSDLFPVWSPDGRWVAYTDAPQAKTFGGNDALMATDRRSIWVMKPDGSQKHPLMGNQGFDDERAQWSRDSGEILFARLAGDTAQLWLMRADGSNPRRIVDTLSPSPGRLGIYGYHDWTRLYDWWRGGKGGSP